MVRRGVGRGGGQTSPVCLGQAINGEDITVYGEGKQTRSFCFVDDCVEGTLRIMRSDYDKPLNLGSDEKVTMNQMAEMIFKIGNKTLPIKHIPGPEGVRGRNSDNTLIKEVLGWAPSITLFDGLTRTHKWISDQVEKDKVAAVDVAQYSQSKVFEQTTQSLDALSK